MSTQSNNQPLDDSKQYQDEHVLLPGASAGSVSADEINALAAAEVQAAHALFAAEIIAATSVQGVRRIRRPSAGLEP